MTAPAYRLSLSKTNGAILDLVDRASGTHLVRGSNGCLWGAVAEGESATANGCAFAPKARNRFSYRWDRATETLTLTYDGDDAAAKHVEAVAALHADTSFFDLRLTLENHWRRTLDKVVLPADLLVSAETVESGYAPNYLPGVRLGHGFFTRVGDNVLTYPSRWAFADFLALDVGGAHVALYGVNPPPSPIQPVELGFVHASPSAPCSGRVFCVTHALQTAIADGASWTSPTVRIRVGDTVDQTILGYRQDNGIDAYPSLADKLGARLATLARAPLIKADLWKGLGPFVEWDASLRRLPSPALLHPVAYQPRGHDENDPDFLPPDPSWGSTADFRAMVQRAHALGLLVMPYDNVSWWDDQSPTLHDLPAPLKPKDVSVQDERGDAVLNWFGDHRGYVTSPSSPFVRARVAQELEQWRTQVPVDCVFFDQIGARTWTRDFNPAEPTPLAYYDGWLALMAPYADRCLMAEDGWDRLAKDFVAFHGGMLMMDREHDEPNVFFGRGNWRPYPLGVWLFHDKVLLYQHDLYEGTMTGDDEVLSWNMAFGMQLSFRWNELTHSLDDPWLAVVGTFQHVLGPYYAGRPLTAYRNLEDDVTESTFGDDYTVVANWSRTGGYDAGGYGIAPLGFLARAKGDAVLAGTFAGSFDGVALSPGAHHVLVERAQDAVTVRQPLGADTDLAVEPPASWHAGDALHAHAIGPGGRDLGDVGGAVRDGRFVFRYAAAVSGVPVAYYRIASA